MVTEEPEEQYVTVNPMVLNTIYTISSTIKQLMNVEIILNHKRVIAMVVFFADRLVPELLEDGEHSIPIGVKDFV